METTNEALLELARKTTAKFIELDARCEALAGFARTLAFRTGLTEPEIAIALQRFYEYAYEKALHQLEDEDPGLAAQLDLRNPPQGAG
jgi:hypothetical protein